jgi:hypothetical protein
MIWFFLFIIATLCAVLSPRVANTLARGSSRTGGS